MAIAAAVGTAPAQALEPAEPAPPAAALTPRLGISAGVNDNIGLAPAAGTVAGVPAPIASRFVTWTPELAFSLPDSGGTGRVDLNLRGELTHYAARSDHDTRNAEASLDVALLLGERTAVAARALAQDGHDAVGATDLSVGVTTPNHFRAFAAGVLLRHDSDDERVRTEGELTASRKRYLNHRDVTLVGDVHSGGLVGRAFRTVSAPGEATTRVLVEARALVARYPAYPAVLVAPNNVDGRLLGGLQREPADDAATGFSGTVKLGFQSRHFSTARPGYFGPTWEAALRWQARASTLWEAGTSRAASDAPGDGAHDVQLQQQSLAWTEQWRADLRSTLAVQAANGRYRSSAPEAARIDRARGVDIGLRYDLRQDAQIGLNWSYARRRSSLPGFDHVRHIGSVMLQVSI